MKQYEEKKFELWREQVETHLLSYLKRNLLTRSTTGSATTRSASHMAKDDAGAEDDYRSPVHSKYMKIAWTWWGIWNHLHNTKRNDRLIYV